MKNLLHYYGRTAAVFMMVCSVAAASAQTLVTSLSQLRVGSVVKIYPKASDGTSQYEANMKHP